MTNAQVLYKKSLIKRIHANKKNVFNSDEDRKLFLKSHIGKESLTEMSIDELKHFLNFLLGRGAVYEISHLATSAQSFKIEEIWRQKARDKGASALCAFIKRIIKRDPPKELKYLKKQEATDVLIALNHIKKQKGGR
jgi:hypothetical protein